jgi:hypothetical protein
MTACLLYCLHFLSHRMLIQCPEKDVMVVRTPPTPHYCMQVIIHHEYRDVEHCQVVHPPNSTMDSVPLQTIACFFPYYSL